MVAGSVLILTAGFGEGHNAAARNLEAAFKESHPGIRVAVHDIFSETYPWLSRVAQWSYKIAINRAPSVWSVFFHILDRAPLFTRGVGLLWRARKALDRKIVHLNADVVVSCFPGYGILLDSVRKRAGRPFTFVTMVTDSLTINSIWWRCSSDLFLVPNEPTARELEGVGIARRRLKVTGFPVPLAFCSQDFVRVAPPEDGLWKVLYMVNSGHHLAVGIARALLALDNIALTVTCGKDATLKQKLQTLGAELDKPIELHGWTDQMPTLIRRSHVLISKAGGATVQESLAARTPMILTQVVPGQEEGNARLVVENEAGEIARTPEEIAGAVHKMFEKSGSHFARRYKAAARLSHPTGARDAANFVASVCLKI
jgi:processive 1,2-diacylglycerol beta-glucosyltransferase